MRPIRHAFWAALFACADQLDAQVVRTWTDINPSQSALAANGGSGGRVNGLGRSATGSAFYAASEMGGLYKSADGGLTWTHLSGHVPMVTWDVDVDPSNANRVYATSWYDGKVASRAGISVSIDGGVTWTKPATATPAAGVCEGDDRRDNPSAFGIAIDPANTNRVFIGTNCGLARSLDAGATWTFIDPDPGVLANDVWDVAIHHGNVVDACGDDGHARSTDGGVNWTTSANLPTGRCSIAVSPDEANVVFVVFGSSVYQTADGGVTWSSITNPDPPPNGRIPFVAVNDRAGAAFDLWFGDVRLYRASCSTPSSGTAPRCPANTWTQSDAGAHNDVGDVAFAAGAAGDACPVLFSSDGGVYRNTATANPACQTPAWTQPNVTPHALRVYSMAGVRRAGAANEELYLGLQDNGSFATVNLGAAAPSWTNVDCCDVYSIATDAVKVMSSWVGTSIFLRDPGLVGAMTPLTNPPPGFLIATRYLESLVSFGPSSYAAVTTTGIHVTTDGGATWTQLGAASTPFGAKNIWVSGSGSALTFHVQGGDGSGRNADAIYKFLGTGAGSWQPVNPPGGVGGFNVFAVDRRFPNNLFASHVQPGLDPAMVRSSDGGVTWSHIPALDNLMTGGGAFRYRNTRGPVAYGNSAQPTLNGYPMPSLVFIDSVDNRVMVAGGAESGVFLSLDGGSTWETITDPLTPSTSGTPHLPRPVFAYVDRDASLVINPKLTVYIGTDGRGVWRFTRSEPRNIYEICGDGLRAQCIAARLDRGLITLDCASDPRRCRFTDLLPNNCRLKWSCPPCRAGGLCPPFYDIYFDGLDLDLWEVALYARMQQVPHEVFRTATGAVLSFQPSREMFRDDVIGGFTLVFALKPAGKAGTFPIRTRLEVADRPYSARVPSRPGNLRVLPP